jgi:hypothetical protein
MRNVARLALVVLVSPLPSAAARPPESSEFEAVTVHAEKLARLQEVRSCLASQSGEDLANPIPIETLPFRDAGSTCGFRDDLTPECTFLGGSPDVVYAFTPADDMCVEISLCDSGYDTALHVHAAGVEVACSDDGCGSRSRLERLRLAAGVPYSIVVDGWAGECGSYVLDVHECPPPCVVEIPSGAVAEGEPPCADRHIDRFNTGCNGFPYAFSDLPCSEAGVAVHGTYGTWVYEAEEQRDTDWYQVVVTRPSVLDLRVVGAAPTQIAILDGTLGCGEWYVPCGSVLGEACEPIACRAEVPPGTYWLFVAPRRFDGVPCVADYVLTLTGHGCPPVGVAPSGWGQVKSRYR